jgi:hypothetical protein
LVEHWLVLFARVALYIHPYGSDGAQYMLLLKGHEDLRQVSNVSVIVCFLSSTGIICNLPVVHIWLTL